MAQPPIGIDLGTTFSVVATVNDEGQVEILRNSIGQNLTPSVVYFESADNLVVGQAAKDARVNAPSQVAEFIKRQMGSEFEFPVLGRSFSPIEISGIILKKLKSDAETALNGTTIQDAVVTCPAYFTAEQRDATEKAAIMAGLNLLALVNEPTAAAMAFGMDGTKQGNTLIFDLGGGTFDVTILRFAPGVIDVLVSDGDHELGGKDFDDAIMRMAIDFFYKETGFNLTEDPEARAELRDKAENAKRTLSNATKTSINMAGGGHRAKFEISREEFEEAISGQMALMRGVLEDALAEAGLSASEMDDVLLVGGSTYIPAIRQMVQDFFGRVPNMSINPDEAVARGAALYAAQRMAAIAPEIRSGRHSVSEGVKKVTRYLPAVQDIVNHSIGITAVRDETDRKGYNSIILQRGTKLPAASEEEYYTISDGQESVATAINEGEDEDLDNINQLKKLSVPLGGPKPRNYPFKVKIELDLSGILRVTFTDSKTGRKEKIEIKYEQNLTQAEVDSARNWLAAQKVE